MEHPSLLPPAAYRGVAQPALTRRENEIMHWVIEGKRDREIAIIIGVSPRTVENHLAHILRKLCVETRTAAACLCLRHHPGWALAVPDLPPEK